MSHTKAHACILGYDINIILHICSNYKYTFTNINILNNVINNYLCGKLHHVYMLSNQVLMTQWITSTPQLDHKLLHLS